MRERKTARVLSAGGMFGAYQAGAYRAIAAHTDIDMVVGASVGALNGWPIASGCTPEHLIARWLDPSAGEALETFSKRRLARHLEQAVVRPEAFARANGRASPPVHAPASIRPCDGSARWVEDAPGAISGRPASPSAGHLFHPSLSARGQDRRQAVPGWRSIRRSSPCPPR